MDNVIDFAQARNRRMNQEASSEERLRAISRVVVDRPVQVTLENGLAVGVPVDQLSLDGVRLRTDRDRAFELAPLSRFLSGDAAAEVATRLLLPFPGGDLNISGRCRFLGFKLMWPDDVTFTLRFETFEGAGRRILRHFLDLDLELACPTW